MSNGNDYDFDSDSDIGLGGDDKGRIRTNQVDWYKGEKGRTDRVALVYFNPIVVNQVKKLAKAKPGLTEDQKREAASKILANLAQKVGKSVDQLEPADTLDLTEARFRVAEAAFKQGLGFVQFPKRDGLTQEELKVWSKVGDPRTYVTTLLLVYPTDSDGEVDMDRLAKGGWKLKPWRFSPEKYDKIFKINKGLAEAGSSVTMYDLFLSCKETQYQQIDITQAGPAIWMRHDALKRPILNKASDLYSKINPFRVMTTDELREKLGMSAPAVSMGGMGGDLSTDDVSSFLKDVLPAAPGVVP
jgi:hypothetical protein